MRIPAAVLLLGLSSIPAFAQAPLPAPSRDSEEVAASTRYAASGLRRFLLGSGYRDLWATSMRVEVLDLRTFGGGLRPVKVGGGNQTKSLRFVTPDDVQYVFRSMDKADAMGPGLDGTVIAALYRDQISTNHPGAPLVAARLLTAAGVLHVAPIFAIMPDDSLLGEFRKEFAGRLGMIEESPTTPKHHPGFGGAVSIIDSDTLRALLDRDPEERIDAPAFLAARLMDMLFGDWDRHPGQWKWARMGSSPRTSWLPIPRDRDKTFTSSGGLLLKLGKLASPNLYAFTGTYPSVQGLTKNSLELDRRLLGGLARSVWDSVTVDLMSRITDSTIDDAVLALPAEYLPSAAQLARTLKLRRDAWPVATDHFYHLIATVADIHATDAADRARVTRVGDRFVDVQLASGASPPYFVRRFDRQETSEIRIYLHGGADSAVITGNVQRSIPVRIIGGNGANHLIDSSRVADSHDRAHLYDVSKTTGVQYGPDTLFNREPWFREHGKAVPPGPDRGGRVAPIVGFNHDRDLGYVARLGIYKVTYGFGRRPYASRVALDVAYATGLDGFRVAFAADRRFEGTPVHLLLNARMSELEVVSFHGYGNDTPGSLTNYFDARQRQWLLAPAVAIALGPRSDLSFGPVAQLSVADQTPNRFITTAEPYGFGRFGQAGLRLSLHHDVRDLPRDPHRGLLVDFSGSFFPAVWDVTSAFEKVIGNVKGYVTLPVPAHPILVVTGGGTKLFGSFPFHEAAFIGGAATMRSLDAQRFSGDAAEYGSVELRIPVAKFAFVLPMTVGVFGVVDAGRVFVGGDSPGGWHTSRGIGFWIGVFDPSSAIRGCWRPGQGGPC